MFVRSHSRQLCDMPKKRRVLDTYSTLPWKPMRRVSLYNNRRGTWSCYTHTISNFLFVVKLLCDLPDLLQALMRAEK